MLTRTGLEVQVKNMLVFFFGSQCIMPRTVKAI